VDESGQGQMNAWELINLVWSAVLLLCSIGLFLHARGIEYQQRELRKFQQWNENEQRKQRQL
jgi:hypothetical protein